jgi:hypothetical protein
METMVPGFPQGAPSLKRIRTEILQLLKTTATTMLRRAWGA